MTEIEQRLATAYRVLREANKQMESDLEITQNRWKPTIDSARTELALAESLRKQEIADLAVASGGTAKWMPGTKVMRKQNVYWRYGREVKSVDIITGILEIRTPQTIFAGNAADYSLPSIGDTFVRILSKDGTPGARFECIYDTFNNLGRWAPVDPNTAIINPSYVEPGALRV